MKMSNVSEATRKVGAAACGRLSARGFTIVELLITVIVIGILAAAGLAKYQNFAEMSRRKTCVAQLKQIETAFQTWQNNNVGFGRDAKTAWTYGTRTGRLMTTGVQGVLHDYMGGGEGGTIMSAAPAKLDFAPVNATGAPENFKNNWSGSASVSGPLNSVLRDDKVWTCPSALTTFYGGDVANIDAAKTTVGPNTFTDDAGLRPNTSVSMGGTNIVGVFGRYGMVVVGDATDAISGQPFDNTQLPANWVTRSQDTSTKQPAPAPQPPFSIALCGCYGTFGPSTVANTPGNQPVTGNGGGGGGPVGANGSDLSRHSTRW